MKSLRQILCIAKTTALEGLQQPICLLLLLSMVVLVTLGPLVQMFTFGEEGRLARDSGLAMMLMLGLFTVAFTSGFTMSDELRRGTAAVTLTKPVHRLVFLLGKFLGVVIVLALFAWCGTVTTLLAERTAEHYIELPYYADSMVDRFTGIGALLGVGCALAIAAVLNFIKHYRFGLAAFVGVVVSQTVVLVLCGFITRAGTLTRFDLQVNRHIIPAAILVFMLLVLYAALATALSTRLPTGATLVTCGIVLFLGFLSGHIYSMYSSWLSAVFYTLIPDVQHFWMSDALANGGAIPLRYVTYAALYILTMAALFLSAGYAMLKSRDLA